MDSTPLPHPFRDSSTPADFVCRGPRRDEFDAGLAAAPALVFCADAAGRLTRVSDAWLAKFGYTREEALGRPATDFLAPESRARAFEIDGPTLLRTGRLDNAEYQMLLKDGRVVDVLMTSVRHEGERDGDFGSSTVITDVTALAAKTRALAASEARYRGLVEEQSEMVSLATPGGELLFVNGAYAALFARPPREVVGTNLFDYIPEGPRERVADLFRRLRRLGQSVETENQVILPSGETRWIAWTNRAIAATDGRVTTIHSVGRDIERRVAAERRLRESEARYRLLAENSSDMVMLVRCDGRRLYASPACRKLLGFEPEEMLGIATEDAVHPDDLVKIRECLANSGPRRTTLSYRMRRKDESFVWVEASTQQVAEERGPASLLVVVRDIEQRVETERRMAESEAAYRLLAENSSDMVFRLDANLSRQYISPACREILGYEPSELIGRRPVEACHPDDQQHVARAMGALLAGEVSAQTFVNRRQHRDGRWVWMEANVRSVRDPATGAFLGLIGASRDISQRKAIEEQLAQANRRLEVLAAEDALTGLANRRAFDDALAREYRRALRENHQIAVIMIDVDCFKLFNDCYGHPAGDACLRRVAAAIADSIHRAGDLAARYGGEEFAVVLPNTDENGGAEVAERIRAAVRALALRHATADAGIVTVSAGVASMRSRDRAQGREIILADADSALYASKNGGRDRVTRASLLTEAGRTGVFEQK
jgi:diguanylate cyclase (GGDEF)-like protein/PAS domain S-box-containing protein